MMLDLSIAVTLEDGTTYPGAKMLPGDIVAFERQFGISSMALNDDNACLEHMMFLAWRPLHRKNMYGGTFDEFCDLVTDIDVTKGTAEAPTPTLPAP